MEPHSINRCGRKYSSFLFLYWKAGRAGTQRKYSAKPHSRNPPNVFRIIIILLRIEFGGFCHTRTFADRCQILQTEPLRPRFDAFAGEVCSFSGQLFRTFLSPSQCRFGNVRTNRKLSFFFVRFGIFRIITVVKGRS